jgi:hypothetical protein
MKASAIMKIGAKYFYVICACHNCNINPYGEIPTFNGMSEISRSGWVQTNDKRFCHPNDLIVWVCPSCWKKHTTSKTQTTGP